MNQEILDKIVSLAAKDPDRYQLRSGDDSVLNRFYGQFPLESLPGLTLDQYCLGHACKPDNFSWWLERGLQKAIGTYSPGTSRGHLIYLQKGGGYYLHRHLADLGPAKAIDVVRKTLHAIASCATLEEARVLDDPKALSERAGIDPGQLLGGPARMLRILTMYHPDWMLPINSIDHLKHFLTRLSDVKAPVLPEKSIELVIELSARLDEVRKATGIAMTPWGFSDMLYSEELGIVPPKRDSIYKDDAAGGDGKSDGLPWWKRFFESEEQGYAAFDLFHEACKALGVTGTRGTSAHRVSFTNTRSDGVEKLGLNCGNTRVLEITSPPDEKPNSKFIARIAERSDPPVADGRFKTPYVGQMLALYEADFGELLEADSDSRKLFFNALGDVAATYTNIQKRHFEAAHRPRLLYAAYHEDRRPDMLANGPTAKPGDEDSDPKPTGNSREQAPRKNLILYGPPGTGKTYSSIDRALEIIDPDLFQSTMGEDDGRSKRKARFDEHLQAKRIGFVTFHQSFSYEDFVEGLKASTDENGQVRYEVEDGIFKQMCLTAAASSGSGSRAISDKKVDPAGRTIWKMSLGNTLGPDAAIYGECIENGYVLLGWGEGVDFTGASTRESIKAKVEALRPEGWESEYTVTACHAFVNTMKPGDLIIVSDGNHKFRAIGVVKGDYRILPADEDRGFTYRQCRDVEWIRTYVPSLPNDQLMNVAFSQASIYRLKPPAIDLDLVRSLVNDDGSAGDDSPRPFVLIIDEINRGNISRVFGELITLIEDSKRTGNSEALSVKLPYSKEMFSVPANLFLIGTMNTADRSLAQVDIALRRRFVFEELMPDPSILSKLPPIDGIHVDKMLTAMNRRIEVLYDREHTIGHTFFLSLNDDPSLAQMKRIFAGSILPLLEEYFFEDWAKIRLVLGDHQKPPAFAMIKPKYSDADLEALFGADPEHPINHVYERNEAALLIPESYIGIYDPSVSNGNKTSTPIA